MKTKNLNTVYKCFENKEFKDEPEVMVMAEHLEITEAQPWINKKELFIYIAGFFSGVFAMWIKGLFFF